MYDNQSPLYIPEVERNLDGKAFYVSRYLRSGFGLEVSRLGMLAWTADALAKIDPKATR